VLRFVSRGFGARGRVAVSRPARLRWQIMHQRIYSRQIRFYFAIYSAQI
jgi:hypothetical protein